MSNSHHYDTVAFDVRDNATMLFFAQTGEHGDIDRYFLIVRTIEDDFDETLHIEIDDRQVGGKEFLSQARLVGNTLTLVTREPPFQILGCPASLFRMSGEGDVIQLDESAAVVLGIETSKEHAVGQRRIGRYGQGGGHAV